MNYSLCFAFALLPSIIWLLFFLRKDAHPESNRMVMKIFFWGMLVTSPAILIEMGFLNILERGMFGLEFKISGSIILILYIFIGIALVEEFLKYLVVKDKVLKNPEFDEPVDVMLYMIIAALGFAALENILILWPLTSSFYLFETFLVSAFRFIGATLLHALCSAMVGYFLALAIFYTKKRTRLILSGLTGAVVLHGLFNFSIITFEGSLKFILPSFILIGLAIFVSFGFKKLKKMKSVCRTI